MSHRGIRHIVAALLLFVGLGAGMAVAGAQDDSAQLVLRTIDSRDRAAVALDFVYTGAAGDVDGLTLTENGEPAEIQSVEPLPSTPIGVVFVVDTSLPMDESGALVAARSAMASWVESAPANVQFSLVGAGQQGVMLQDLTSNESQMLRAIEDLAPAEIDAGAVWSGVQLGAAALRSENGLQPNLVVISGSTDPNESDAEGAATGEALTAGATVFGVAYTGSGASADPLDDLVTTTGGLMASTDQGPAVEGLVGTAQEAVSNQQYRVTINSATAAELAQAQADAEAAAEESGEPVVEVPNRAADFELTVGGQTASGTVVLGGVARGEASLNPTEIAGGGGIPFLQNPLGLGLAILITLIAGVLLAYGITSIFVQDDSLTDALRPYSDAYAVPSESGEPDEQSRTALIKRAVEITEQVAESQGYLSRAEAALERANLPLRAGEALFFYAAVVLLVTIGAIALFQNLLIGLILGGLAAMIPVAVVNFKATQRKKKFLSQLPDTLTLLSGTLRAGYSLMQGVEAVSQEVEEPMGYELRRVVTESRLGRPLEEALDGAAERMDSPDFAWAVMAIRIQREVGGNLSELLMTVADTMGQRERLRRDVASLTAEGRVSAIVLGLLPPGLGAVMFVINPDYTKTLFSDTLGIIMIIVAVISMLIGFFWMKKIIDIEI